jgi:hypothetical protein
MSVDHNDSGFLHLKQKCVRANGTKIEEDKFLDPQIKSKCGTQRV